MSENLLRSDEEYKLNVKLPLVFNQAPQYNEKCGGNAAGVLTSATDGGRCKLLTSRSGRCNSEEIIPVATGQKAGRKPEFAWVLWLLQ
jgi:hypothetical protein